MDDDPSRRRRVVRAGEATPQASLSDVRVSVPPHHTLPKQVPVADQRSLPGRPPCRVTAADVRARRDLPPYSRVRMADLLEQRGDGRCRLVDESLLVSVKTFRRPWG